MTTQMKALDEYFLMVVPAGSFIFHGEDEIKFLATINFDVDSANVGSKWFNDTMFRELIKLNIQTKLYAALLN